MRAAVVNYCLSVGISFCIANGRAVFLDVISDHFSGLPDPMDLLFQRLVAGEALMPDDYYQLDALVRAGLLARSRINNLPSNDTQRPRQSVRIGREEPKPALALMQALAAQALAKYEIRWRPLHKTIERIQRRKLLHSGKALNHNVPAVRAGLSGFHRSRRWIKSTDYCLREAVALIDILAAHRCFPDLVIGVRMQPYAAHAWVQAEDAVLTDDFDVVARYTPILVI